MATTAKKKTPAPTLAEQILQADRAALLLKAQSGQSLTAAERAMIQAEVSGVSDDVETYVENLTDLAAILGISRPALNTWRQMSGAPKPDSAGRHNTAAWLRFRDERGLKGSETSDEVTERARALRLRNEDLELDLAIKRELFTENGVLIEELSKICADQRKLLRQKLEKEWPGKLPADQRATAREDGRKLVDVICLQMQAIIDHLIEKTAVAMARAEAE